MGDVEMLQHDLELVEQEGAELGLRLNHLKSEVVCSIPDIRYSILSFLPGASVVDPSSATVLGCHIGDVHSRSSSLGGKINVLRKMGERHQHLWTHDAIILLRHSFALPKFLYCLSTSPCFLSPLRQTYDDLLKSTASAVININFSLAR